MKKFFAFILAFLICSVSYADLTEREKTKVLRTVTSVCGEGEYDIYCSSTYLWRTFGSKLSEQSILAFVDLEPNSGWEHPCKYIYISRLTNQYEVVDSLLPPSDLTLLPLQIHNSGQSAMQQFRLPVYHSNDSDTPMRTYAVIINGGMNKNANHERYWNDCSFIYQTLHNTYDIPRSHIKVVFADGTDPALDLIKYDTKELVNSPLDLDGDNTDDIQYAATKANLQTVFQELGNTLTDEDHLFVFVTGHGNKPLTGGTPSLYLWNGELLLPSEFSNYLDMVNAQCISVIMGQCYSGAFIQAVHGNNRIIATACSSSEKSYGLQNIPFDSFLYNWTSAVNRADHLSNTIYSDRDNNGYISMNEAFSYAKAHNPFVIDNNRYEHETPQLDFIAGVLYDDLSFDRMPETVDLYIRDDNKDIGKEPYLQPYLYKALWFSPDLYLRNQDDGVDNHEHEMLYIEDTSDEEATFHIYANVHNRGTKTYNPNEGRKYIHLFVTNSNGGIAYSKFLGTRLYEDEFGECVGTPAINHPISPGDSLLVHVQATIYQDFEGFPWVNNTLPLSLLGEIADSRYVTSTNCDTIRVDTIIKRMASRNNVAMRNVIPLPLDTINYDRTYVTDIALYAADNCMLKIESSNEHLKNIASLRLPNGVRRYRIKRNNIESTIEPAYRDEYLSLNNVEEIYQLNLANIQRPKVALEFSQRNLFESNYISEGDTITILQCDETTGDILAGITYIVKLGAGEEILNFSSMPYMSQVGITDENYLEIQFSEAISDAIVSITSNTNTLNSISKSISNESVSTRIDIPDNYCGVLFIDLIKNGKILDSKKIIK